MQTHPKYKSKEEETVIPPTSEMPVAAPMRPTVRQTVAVRHAHAFLAHSSLMGAYDVRKALEYALSKAGGAQ